ncbi:unnamed protein product, partial [Rotaria magnacalcarata]
MLILFFCSPINKVKPCCKSSFGLVAPEQRWATPGNMSFGKQLRCDCINNPLCEKIRSAGADVTGMHKTFNAQR